MAVIFVGVLVVMAVMNGALFYVLHITVLATRRQVEACFVRELEDYNDYLEEKTRESRQIEEHKKGLKKEIGEMEGVILSLKTSPFYAPRPIARELFIPTARYIDNEFFDNHKRVNDMMKDMDYQEIIDKIEEKQAYRVNLEDYEAACRILKFLSMNINYELCTLSDIVQLDILQMSLQGRERELLDIFLEESKEKEFDVLDFRTFVREVKTAQDPKMYIRTGGDMPEGLAACAELVHQYDGNISEGLKVIYQNQAYDFSIYRLRSRK